MATKKEMMDKARADYERFRSSFEGDYQARFCYELAELEDRRQRLEAIVSKFEAGEPVGFDTDTERMCRLVRQLQAMRLYHSVLSERYNAGQL
jgi:hypothetical protein